jgi:V8-like Glu-specific endopeptidase
MMRNILALVLLTAAISATTFQSAHAFPLPKPGQKFGPQMLRRFSDEGYNFEGIAALSNCSGSLIRFENSLDTDKALILTNGHCYEGGMPAAGQFISHQPSLRRFNLFKANLDEAGSVQAEEVVYSTMTTTDITIYRLSSTYAAIKQRLGVRPLVLSSKHPSVSDKIEVISGYWQRGYTCSIEKFVNVLQEADWTMNDSMRYSRPGCETIGGTSGSPVVLAGTRTVIGINNTGNDNGEKCTMDNPCEIDEKGNVFYQQGLSYAQQTYQIYSCLNANREIDLSTPGCALPH